MTGHRALEKKQITQGNNRKVQNPSESQEGSSHELPFFCNKSAIAYQHIQEKSIFAIRIYNRTFFTY